MPTEVNSVRRNRRRRGRERLNGERFGLLTVLREVGIHRTAGGTLRRIFACQCICGNETRATLQSLRSGDTRSCGCLRRKGRTGPAARASAARWREYHAERRERHAPVIAEFQAVLQQMMAARAIPVELLRLRWPGRPAAFAEIIRKRRRIPNEDEAGMFALALVLRGTERERFMAAARAAREKLIAIEIARKTGATANPS